MIKIFNEENELAGLKRVTSTATVVGDSFAPDGLFSTEIFGSNKPTCKCGAMVGTFFAGTECPSCKTLVSVHHDNGAIIGFSEEIIDLDIKFINPMFVRLMKAKGIDLLSILNPQAKTLDVDGEYLVDDNRVNNLTFLSFVKDFEGSIEILFEAKPDDEFKEFLLSNKEIFFNTSVFVLPINLRSAQIKNNGGEMSISIDILNQYYIELITHFNNIEKSINEFSTAATVENELFEIQKVLAELNDFIIDNLLSGKSGIFRNNILSNRINYSARAPITLRSDELDPQGVTLPREMFIEMYKLKLIRYLSNKLDILYNRAEYHLFENRFNEDDKSINEAINHIIANDNLVVLGNRNPSLLHNNIVAWTVDSVHDSATIAICKMSLPSFAGDIDGDTIAIFTLDSDEAKESAKENFSLEALCQDVYNNGKFGKGWLQPYQDSTIGLWLGDKANYDHILKHNPA